MNSKVSMKSIFLGDWIYKCVEWTVKNEKHFSWGLNIQVCELLQALTEANIKRCFEKKVFLEF